MFIRSLYAKVVLSAIVATFLGATLPGRTVQADAPRTATIEVTAGVPFTTPPVSFTSFYGVLLTVAFTATSSTTGTVTVVVTGAGRGQVFRISAPAGGMVTVTEVSVAGLGTGWRAFVNLWNTSGEVIETCSTTTISFAIDDVSKVVVPPACQAPGAAVGLITALTAMHSVPDDARFFPQTGFRIDNEVIWDYFSKRGGVATFGYPVSNTFLLQGHPVQFFQRRIVQLSHDGQARLLNLLDSGLMPYTSFNYATFPAIDSELVASAPNPTDVPATLAFIKAHAPDTFQGMPVNFYQTFLSTVTYTVAYPSGGDRNLLPGFDLEMWGIPTSQVMMDPNNHDFVYLRFQRGIMMFDASCGCTQGVLLADFLKSILTGTNLPADLEQEAQDSPFYRQIPRGSRMLVRDPDLLPNTDLRGAFSRPQPP